MPLAPVRTASSISSGTKSRSPAAGAWYASFRYAVVAFLRDHHAPLPHLLGFGRVDALRHRAGRDGAEPPLHVPQRGGRLDIAHDHERGVVRNVVAPVVRVEVVARHAAQVAQPADRRVPVRVGLECGRRHLDLEQLVGVVLPALQLGNDDGALGLDVLRVVQAVGHPLGFDEQHAIERVAARRFEVGGLIDPRVAVPRTAELLDDALSPDRGGCSSSP